MNEKEINQSNQKDFTYILNEKQKEEYKKAMRKEFIRENYSGINCMILFFILFIFFYFIKFHSAQEILFGGFMYCIFTLIPGFYLFNSDLKKEYKKRKYYIIKPKIEKIEKGMKNYYLVTYISPWNNCEESKKYSVKFIEELNGKYDLIGDNITMQVVFISKTFENPNSINTL